MRWWKYIYLIACWICWLALAYPFCCMVVLYVAVLSCDDHQLGWWEQLGEVLMVNVDGSNWARFSWSTSEWWFRCLAIWAGVFLVFYLGLRPCISFCITPLRSMLYSYSAFLWHRGVPEFCQGSVKDPRITLLYLYCVSFSFNFA